jgi:hypothetical protein
VSTPHHKTRAVPYSSRKSSKPLLVAGSQASAATHTVIAIKSGCRKAIFGWPCTRRAKTRLARFDQAGAALTVASTTSTSIPGAAPPKSARTMTAAVPPSMTPRHRYTSVHARRSRLRSIRARAQRRA